MAATDDDGRGSGQGPGSGSGPGTSGGAGSGVGAGVGRNAVVLLAGAVDLGLEQAEQLLRRVRGVLSRGDLPDLVRDAGEDLRARGGLTLDRFSPPSESHMEHLARRAAAAQDGTSGTGGAANA